MKYEVTLKNDFGEPNEIVVNTTKGFQNALTAALDSHYDDESEVYEIIIRKANRRTNNGLEQVQPNTN